MRRLACVLVLGALVTAPVSALAADVEQRIDEAARLAESDADAATEILVAVAGDPAASAAQKVRATRLALEDLPLHLGNRAASELVLATLRSNRSQPEAWQLAFRVRDHVMDGLDVVNGEPFLQALIELYPDQLRFQYYLADLYLDAGRPELADARCMEILRQARDDTRARRIQAYVRELDGRVDEALRLYSEIHEISGELEPLLYRVRILIDPLRDYAAAQEALDEALAAVERAPAGQSRNAVRADLEYEETRIEDERVRRAELLAITERQDRLAAGIVAGWLVVLGGGLVLLRRRGLV